MPTSGQSSAIRLTRASDLLRIRMRKAGVKVVPSNPRRGDAREMMEVRLPSGWSIQSDSRISVIFDPEQQPRFVDYHGSDSLDAYIVEVPNPVELLAQLKRHYNRSDAKVTIIRREGFDLMAWMCLRKSAIFHLYVAPGAQQRNDGPRVYVEPQAPGLTGFQIRQLS